jgi:hypothetical protein
MLKELTWGLRHVTAACDWDVTVTYYRSRKLEEKTRASFWMSHSQPEVLAMCTWFPIYQIGSSCREGAPSVPSWLPGSPPGTKCNNTFRNQVLSVSSTSLGISETQRKTRGSPHFQSPTGSYLSSSPSFPCSEDARTLRTLIAICKSSPARSKAWPKGDPNVTQGKTMTRIRHFLKI